MFNHNRSYMTQEQMSFSTTNNTDPQTCAKKYSQMVRQTRIIDSLSNCTKIQRVYNSRGQLIGKNMCIMKLS